MAGNRFYILHFEGDTPQWGIYDGDAVRSSEPPGDKPSLPVVALIPDRFFYFFLPKHIPAWSSPSNENAFRSPAAMGGLSRANISPYRFH